MPERLNCLEQNAQRERIISVGSTLVPDDAYAYSIIYQVQIDKLRGQYKKLVVQINLSWIH
jgi:hypothetical protein